jgi:uncharacterized protein (TIGR03085 family)
MTASSRPLADRERTALADLLAELGPDAPTCCAGWDTAHLAAHVVARDSRPDALPGYGVEQLPAGRLLAAWSHAVEDRLRTSTPYSGLVQRVRSGPPPWSPFAWPGVAQLTNTAELAIHHEDVRRAQPGWAPRQLARPDQDALWRHVSWFGRAAAARERRGLRLRRTDTGAEHVVGGRSPATTVAGEPLELLLWAGGRRGVARVTVEEG